MRPTSHLLLSLLLLLSSLPLTAQSPKVAVIITVEELRSDILKELLPTLPEGGLRYLESQGEVFTQVHHPLLRADATASEAIIHTGTLAVANGISERRPYLRNSNGQRALSESAMEDKDYMGYGTPERRSPIALTASTIGDQLKQSTVGSAYVYSVAPNAEEALIAGGQYANGAFWIDDFTGKWTTSTYYKEGLPWYITKSHFARTNEDNRQYYKTTPQVNAEVFHTAKLLLKQSPLGKDGTPDLLTLHFYGGNTLKSTSTSVGEYQTFYREIDRLIAELILTLNQELGKGNYLLAITGNATAKEYLPLRSDQRTFQPERAKALINMYLIAKYERQNWVQEITPSGELFLDRNLVKQNSQLDLHQLQDEVADFLTEFSGIQYAISDYRLRQEALGREHDRAWQTALNKAPHKHRGDVIFGLLPGWSIEDNATLAEGFTPYRMRSVATTFFLLTPATKGVVTDEEIDLRDLSTIISRELDILPPSDTTIPY